MSEHGQLETPASENPGLREPDRELWRLWREGQRPDVRRFLADAGDLALSQIAAVLQDGNSIADLTLKRRP